jgi:hypothetical protein
MIVPAIAAVLVQSSAEARAAGGLNAFSLAFMLVSITAVSSLTAWCYWRILGGQKHFDPDGTGPAEPPVEGKVEREGGL